jgi:hypothetical protein
MKHIGDFRFPTRSRVKDPFGFLASEDGTGRLSRIVGKKLPLLLRNDGEERSSHELYYCLRTRRLFLKQLIVTNFAEYKDLVCQSPENAPSQDESGSYPNHLRLL